jgi:hypothetical protein
MICSRSPRLTTIKVGVFYFKFKHTKKKKQKKNKSVLKMQVYVI